MKKPLIGPDSTICTRTFEMLECLNGYAIDFIRDNPFELLSVHYAGSFSRYYLVVTVVCRQELVRVDSTIPPDLSDKVMRVERLIAMPDGASANVGMEEEYLYIGTLVHKDLGRPFHVYQRR